MISSNNHKEYPVKKEKRSFSFSSSLSALKEILATQYPGSREDFHEIAKELERFRDKVCNKFANDPQKLFEQLEDFLNYDLLKLLRRKFYNNAPNIDLETLAQSSLADQYLNNMLNPEHTMEGEYFWGSCFHWSIFLKKFIDERRISSLNTQIVKYSNGSHSFVLLSFNGKSFKVEVNGKDNKIMKPFWEYYEIDKNIPLIPNLLKVNKLRGKKEEIKCMYINKDWEECILSLDKNNLEMIIGESFLHYKIENVIFKEIKNLSSIEILNYIIKHSQVSRKDVHEYAEDEIIELASSMISKTKSEEVRNLFKD